MDIKDEFSSLGLSSEAQERAWEAHSRITRGDSAGRVLDDLVSYGFDHFNADRIVEVCVRVRAAAIRLSGVRDLVSGLILMAVTAGIAFATYHFVKPRPGVPMGHLSIHVKIWGVCCAAFVLGLLAMLRGVGRLIGGARVNGDLSELLSRRILDE